MLQGMEVFNSAVSEYREKLGKLGQVSDFPVFEVDHLETPYSVSDPGPSTHQIIPGLCFNHLCEILCTFI